MRLFFQRLGVILIILFLSIFIWQIFFVYTYSGDMIFFVKNQSYSVSSEMIDIEIELNGESIIFENVSSKDILDIKVHSTFSWAFHKQLTVKSKKGKSIAVEEYNSLLVDFIFIEYFGNDNLHYPEGSSYPFISISHRLFPPKF